MNICRSLISSFCLWRTTVTGFDTLFAKRSTFLTKTRMFASFWRFIGSIRPNFLEKWKLELHDPTDSAVLMKFMFEIKKIENKFEVLKLNMISGIVIFKLTMRFKRTCLVTLFYSGDALRFYVKMWHVLAVLNSKGFFVVRARVKGKTHSVPAYVTCANFGWNRIIKYEFNGSE